VTEERRVRTLVVDDEPPARQRLVTLLGDEPDIEVVGEAGSGSAAVRAITELEPDLVFLDIQMPGFDGFDVLRATAGLHHPLVVFVTAYDEHALRAFDVQAVDYVLKPVVEPRFRAAVRRAVARVRETSQPELARTLTRLLESVGAPVSPTPASDERPSRFAIRHEGRVVFVPLREIAWVKADGDFVQVHAGKQTYLIRETMAEVEARLPASHFVRVHRSAIINVDRVREIQSWFKGDYVVLMDEGTKIHTGRTYRERVQALMR
jgi:two-component system LytT family response regulator